MVGEGGFARLRAGLLAALERHRRSIHSRSASNPPSQMPIPTRSTVLSDSASCWWGKVDSNHRRHCQQIYSLSPLATREFPHILFARGGAGGRTRTPDLLITNQLLYRLSYTSIFHRPDDNSKSNRICQPLFSKYSFSSRRACRIWNCILSKLVL